MAAGEGVGGRGEVGDKARCALTVMSTESFDRYTVCTPGTHTTLYVNHARILKIKLELKIFKQENTP